MRLEKNQDNSLRGQLKSMSKERAAYRGKDQVQ